MTQSVVQLRVEALRAKFGEGGRQRDTGRNAQPSIGDVRHRTPLDSP